MTEQPQNVVQATGAVATDVVSGLKQQPMLLALVVLNALAIGLAVWFLRGLQEGQVKRMDQMMALIDRCLSKPSDQPRIPPGGGKLELLKLPSDPKPT